MNILPRRAETEHFELSPIKAMELAAAKTPGAVSLAQGIPSLAPPAIVKEFAIDMLQQGRCDRYSLTPGLIELREEIAFSLKGEGLHYNPDNEIIVTCGSIEGITATLMALTEPGGEVIIPSPTYASYTGSIALAGCRPRYVKLDEENNFDFSIAAMRDAISSRTAAILFCSPNNPTGTVYSEENTRKIISLALEHNLPVVIDEVYKDFYYSADRHFSPAVIPEARDYLIRVCSFSKAFGMTGWRVGFVLANTKNSERILKYHDAMVTCAPVVSQYGAIAALRFGDKFLHDAMRTYRKHRDYTIERLDELSEFVDYQIPKATYFVFPRIKDTVPRCRDSHLLAYDILKKAGVAFVPGIAFGPSGESHLRVNFGRDMSDLEAGMDRFSQYLKDATSGTRHLPTTRERAEDPKKTAAPSPLRNTVTRLLAISARIYLRRNSPKIIGIVGASGKTVVKRTLQDLLERSYRVRGSILSYNTEIGLPLSVLDLRSPRTQKEKTLFPFRMLQRALFGSEQVDYLVLEYGIRSVRDANQLSSIAKPDWLIVTGATALEPDSSSKALVAGIEALCSSVPEGRIFWSANDPHLNHEKSRFSTDRALRPEVELQSRTLTGGKRSYTVQREFIGRNSQLAGLAAVRLAEELNMPVEAIQTWLGEKSSREEL